MQEAKPELFYVRDKEGNLQPVLGFTLDDFDRLIAQDATRRQGPAKPGYRLEKVSATGAVNNGLAEVKIRFTVLVEDEGWVRVPLRLTGAVLRETVVYQGPGKHQLDFDEQAEEYVVWLQGKSEQAHLLDVTALTPLTVAAGVTRLKLSFPRAWSSDLTFTAPVPKALGQVSPGATIDTANSSSTATEFHILGLGNDFSLTWREESPRPESAAAVIEATGAVSSRIDGRSLHCKARLSVRSFGGEFETFRVRLPKGAVLLTEESTDYTVVPLAKARGKNDPPVVEVRLKQRTTGPVKVDLETEQMAAAGEQPTPVDFSGFEVIGAVRQWGHVAVHVDGDWQLLWDTRRMVRQVDSLPPEMDQTGMVAGFEYFAQPFVLSARVVAKESRVYVEPQHLVLVHGTSAELETRLKFRVSGTRVFSASVDMGDWQIDGVEPDSLVNRDQMVTRERSPLNIPLRQGTAGEFEIVLRAHRDWGSTGEPVLLRVPMPQARSATPAQFVVVPDDDVDVEVQEAGTTGIARRYVKPIMPVPQRQQSPLVFQTTGDSPVLAALVKVQQRSVTVAVDTRLHVRSNQVEAHSTLKYQIARQALDHVVLQAPAELIESGNLELAADGVPLTWSVVADPARDPQSPVRLRIGLPAPRIGVYRLDAHYQTPVAKGVSETSSTIQVPMIMPAEGEFHGAEATVIPAEGIECQTADGFWSVVPPDRDKPRLRLSSAVPRTGLAIAAHAAPTARRAVVIERLWLQTALTSQGRLDRLAFTLVTPADQLTVHLPPGAESVQAMRGGVRVTPTLGQAADQLVIPVERVDAPQAIEIQYRVREPRIGAFVSAIELIAPQFESGAWPRDAYWQLVLPANEHLLSFSAAATVAQSWGWQGWRWGRSPVMQQAELEAWSGASSQSPFADQAREYLLEIHEPLNRLGLLTVRRSSLVLFGGGMALGVGLALIYIPRLRHPATILILALAGTAGALLYPEPTLVVAQSALPGAILAIMATWLNRRSMRRSTPSAIVRSAPSSIVDRASTRTHVPARPTPSGSAPTPLHPAGVSDSTSSAELES